MQFRDLNSSKAERSSAALYSAARIAEQSCTWQIAAEFYEDAAQVWPTGHGLFRAGNVSKLLRKADRCRSLADLDRTSTVGDNANE
ncbi:hypothetical protein [Pseudomonas syringae]|uniref:Uncharacterized protein n=1 Tax=Pseudomonas syringae pv. actinidiae TaxID=103796 RepID=A0A2P0QFH1_PSESF|nr:hypothetical protein [Pseudomonas syringae]APQ06961.1 hypothetical protein PsaNZ47_29915 [Pseudomonas syringae pv. actinidiae]ARO44938.1 hypothetical protein [Pseudomonas syringae pv. actinidiae]ARO45041.1 hypothetical protein [Pseudomonas syringae pv. actinidiae]ARO45134.1 hypothetical protein [Pseudomonas syringae pv. actinidiae]MDU8389138.1 hypothetical protein [Pseudomonas syringae pv. actinidiae]